MLLTSPVTFGPFTLEPAQRLLRRDDQVVKLPPKAMDLLLVLVGAAGSLVSKDELMARVWPGTFVEEGNLPVTVFALRKALGDTGEQYIRTVPKYGYCFVAPVTAAPGPSQPSSERPLGAESPQQAVTVDLPVPPASSEAFTALTHQTAQSAGPSRWRVLALAASLVLAAGAVTAYWLSQRLAQAVVGPISSMVVLPFDVIDGGPDEALLGAGLAADIVDRLNTAGSIRVRPLASSLKFEDARDAAKAADALKADAVLTGTIRRSGASLELTVELVRGGDGARLWSMPGNRRTTPFAQAGGHVVAEVLKAVESSSNGDRPDVRAPHTPSADAYRSYLEGLALASQMTAPEMVRAIGQFEKAAATDPNFADAQSALARFNLLPIASAPTATRLNRVRQAATRALALTPARPAPRAALATVRILADGQWDAGLEEGRLAIAQSPNDAELRLWHAIALGAHGSHDDALSEIDGALALDPTSSRLHLYRGILLTMARR